MEIILMGYMASGKSTIAKKLAAVLDLKMIDLDDYISQKEGITIPEIFKNKGEIYFRKQEIAALKEIFKNEKGYILSLGGGTPCYANNIDLIKSNATSFYLKGSIQTLYDRLVVEKNDRPLIKNVNEEQLIEFIAKHLFERAPFYEQANFNIKIDSKSSSEIVEEIKLSML